MIFNLCGIYSWRLACRGLALLVLAVALATSPGIASAGTIGPIPLSELLDGGGIDSSDGRVRFNKFRDFSVIPNPPGLPDSDGIFVTLFEDSNCYELLFQIAPDNHVGPGEFIDFHLEYDAVVVDPTTAFADLTLAMTGFAFGRDGMIIIGETLVGNRFTDALGVGDGEGLPIPTEVTVDIPPLQRRIRASKDVFMDGGDEGFAFLSDFSQKWTVITEIPEPATACLFLAGCATLLLIRRRMP